MSDAASVPTPTPPPQTASTKTAEAETMIKPNIISNNRPWYRAGGMEINLNGMALNIGGTVALLVSDLDVPHQRLFVAVLLCSYTAAALTTNAISTYCLLAVPTFFTSLLLVLSLDSDNNNNNDDSDIHRWMGHVAAVLAASVALSVTKVNICMSVCLHRYAAHQAFTCGPVTNLFLCLLGCLAIQGGPLWWASQHRCHHKLSSLFFFV